jgi:hypothetical protein
MEYVPAQAAKTHIITDEEWVRAPCLDSRIIFISAKWAPEYRREGKERGRERREA